MEDYSDNEVRIASGLNVLAAIWLIIAPFILNYTSTGNKWQEVIVGIAIGVFALIRIAVPRMAWPSWANVILGAWLIIAPWSIANTSTAAKWNEVILGIIVAVLALGSVSSTMSISHPQHS